MSQLQYLRVLGHMFIQLQCFGDMMRHVCISSIKLHTTSIMIWSGTLKQQIQTNPSYTLLVLHQGGLIWPCQFQIINIIFIWFIHFFTFYNCTYTLVMTILTVWPYSDNWIFTWPTCTKSFILLHQLLVVILMRSRCCRSKASTDWNCCLYANSWQASKTCTK